MNNRDIQTTQRSFHQYQFSILLHLKFDITILLFQPGKRISIEAFRELRKGLPFLDIGLAGPKRFELYVNRLFAEDRYGESKGMIEVIHDASK